MIIMNNTWRYIRIISSLLSVSFAGYIFILVSIHPEKHHLPFLEIGTRIVSDYFSRCQDKPVLYPSQLDRINSYLRGLNSEICEGFQNIVLFARKDHRQTYRWPSTLRKMMTWWESNNREGDAVSWLTAPPLKKQKTTFIFNGALGMEDGIAELILSERPVLVFDTGKEFHRKIWKENGFELRFFPLSLFTYESGIFCLTVPAEVITEGDSLQITVKGKEGKNQYSYFAIHECHDLCKILGNNALH
jgi:hypothetical protein